MGAEDDVGVGFGEAEEVAVEEELVELGEREGAGPGVEGLELDAAEAAGLPVGVVGEDFEGEHRGGTQRRVEEVEEVLRGRGLGDVGHANRVGKGCRCRPHDATLYWSDCVSVGRKDSRVQFC